MRATADEVLLEVEGIESALLVAGDDLYAAHFDRNNADLRASRLRVFHLDSELRRVEPDRTYAGWGGLSPSGIALAIFEGEPWLVWQTVDARLDPHDVLFAFPLRGPACARSVGAPIMIGTGAPTTLSRSFAAVSDGSRLWIARVEGNGSTASSRSLHIYVLESCGS